jgi:histidine triad (HIT) family protein
MQEDSIFTKIIKGEIPCHKIYEDDQVLAFLDIHPASKGHTLVIPKAQIDQVWDISDSQYRALLAVTKKIALHLREVLQVKRVGVKVIGVDVPHAHIQLIPFDSIEQYDAKQPGGEPNHRQLASLAQQLAVPRE